MEIFICFAEKFMVIFGIMLSAKIVIGPYIRLARKTKKRTETQKFCFIKDNDRRRLIAVSKETYSSIVESIYIKKIGQFNNILFIICINIVIYYFLNIFFNINIEKKALIFLYILIGFIAISKWLISYRVRNGYYGTNYDESQEILYHIISDKDKNDKDSGMKVLKFDEIDAYAYEKKRGKKMPADDELQYL